MELYVFRPSWQRQSPSILSKTALRNRGYDQNGSPFAPCGLLTRPNGFAQEHQRLTFCCFKQCLNLGKIALENLQDSYNISVCPHILKRFRATILGQITAIALLLKGGSIKKRNGWNKKSGTGQNHSIQKT